MCNANQVRGPVKGKGADAAAVAAKGHSNRKEGTKDATAHPLPRNTLACATLSVPL